MPALEFGLIYAIFVLISNTHIMRLITILCAIVLFTIGTNSAEAQIIKKIKKGAKKGILKELGIENKNPNTPPNPSTPSNDPNSNNSSGAGLKMTPPDVNANIAEARSALGSKSFSQTRYAIQEAMRGVELQIGENILESFPANVNGLNAQTEKDQITSSGYGFVGFNVGRSYQGGNQELGVLVNNNSVMVSGVNTYMMNAGYSQTNSDGPQYKRTTVQGNKALITYDDSQGYKLSVPLGQSTIFVMSCVNFSTEDEVMSAADMFDLNQIKAQLGEN